MFALFCYILHYHLRRLPLNVFVLPKTPKYPTSLFFLLFIHWPFTIFLLLPPQYGSGGCQADYVMVPKSRTPGDNDPWSHDRFCGMALGNYVEGPIVSESPRLRLHQEQNEYLLKHYICHSFTTLMISFVHLTNLRVPPASQATRRPSTCRWRRTPMSSPAAPTCRTEASNSSTRSCPAPDRTSSTPTRSSAAKVTPATSRSSLRQ